MTHYQITRQNLGGRREDYTPAVIVGIDSINASDDNLRYCSEQDARDALAEYVGNKYYDWLTMEDENEYDRTIARIKDGYSFTDGDGVTYSTREIEVGQLYSCDAQGNNREPMMAGGERPSGMYPRSDASEILENIYDGVRKFDGQYEILASIEDHDIVEILVKDENENIVNREYATWRAE